MVISYTPNCTPINLSTCEEELHSGCLSKYWRQASVDAPVASVASVDLGQQSTLEHHRLFGWWFQTLFIFHHIWDVILPIDELHHFSDG
jgi:hypothetical protein